MIVRRSACVGGTTASRARSAYAVTDAELGVAAAVSNAAAAAAHAAAGSGQQQQLHGLAAQHVVDCTLQHQHRW